MKNRGFTLLFLLIVLAVGLLPSNAQTLNARGVWLKAEWGTGRELNNARQTPDVRGIRLNGVVVYISTIAMGRITNEGVRRSINIHEKDNTVEMMLINDLTGLYIGYGLQVELLDQATRLRISIKPLSEEANKQIRNSIWAKQLAAKWPNKADNDPEPLPRYPTPEIVNLDDTLTLALWVNPETGATVSDRIRFELDQPSPARDFTLNEVRLNLSDFRLLINGTVRSGERRFIGVSGSLPWLYVPGKGRFIFSLQPHSGNNFQKIGLIERNKLSFSYDGDNYEWISSALILGSGNWNLWVFFDGNFKEPAGALAEVNQMSKGNCCLYGALGSPALLPGADK